MQWSIGTFIEARDAVAQLLSDLPLQNFRFDVEPHDDGWQVRLEYAAGQTWKEATLHIEHGSLERALRDTASRREVVERWKQQLHVMTTVEPA